MSANGGNMMASHNHPCAHPYRNDGGEQEIEEGPRMPQTAYPYYTTRGPRDFLAKNPPSIGP
jgi:hypothetical protein